MGALRRNSDAVLALGVFGVLAIMMVPLPPLVLDLLLAASIVSSLLIFLVAITRSPTTTAILSIGCSWRRRGARVSRS